MSVFVTLRKDSLGKMDDEKKQLTNHLDILDITVKESSEIIPSGSITYTLDDIMSLGGTLSSVASALSAVHIPGTAGKTLYEVTFPAAGKLMKAKDGSGFLGGIVNSKGKIVRQARLNPVKGSPVTVSGPAIFLALAVLSVKATVKKIDQGMKEILAFLEVEKQTELKGDLAVLADTLSDYAHNWDNVQFISNRETQVMNIKRGSEQNILFYREMIDRIFEKKKIVHLDTAKTLNSAREKMSYYKLALYLYAFSSFLDVILLGNYDKEYVDSVKERIGRHSREYETFYEQTIEKAKGFIGTSVQARTLQGLSIAGKFAGKQISKIPDKQNKIRLDEKLISGGEKLQVTGEKSIDDAIAQFETVCDSDIVVFIDKLDLMKKLYNEPVKLLFDEDNIYIS